jgi:hypothetical protein
MGFVISLLFSAAAWATPTVEKFDLGVCKIESLIKEISYNKPPYPTSEGYMPSLESMFNQPTFPESFRGQVLMVLVQSLEREMCVGGKPKKIEIDISYVDVSLSVFASTEKIKELSSKDLGEFSVVHTGDIIKITGLFVWNSRYVIWDQYALHNGLQDKCEKNILPYEKGEYVDIEYAYLVGKHNGSTKNLSFTLLQSKLEKAKDQYSPDLLWFFNKTESQSTSAHLARMSENALTSLTLNYYLKIIEDGISTALKGMRPVTFSRCVNGSYGTPPRIPKIDPPYIIDH